MTKDRFSGPGRSPFNLSRAMKWKNTSDEAVPAYGVVKLDSYDVAGDFFLAVKPDGEGNLHFVNGPVAVAVNAYGGSQLWNHSRIGKTSSITFGADVGPVAGSWEMGEGGTGFVIFSTPVDGLAAILQVGGGSVETAYALIAESGKDDEFQTITIYRSASPDTFTESTCGSVAFDNMEFNLFDPIGEEVVLVPAGYKAGEALLLKFNVTDSEHAWSGWAVVAGPTLRCAVKIPTKIECCPTTKLNKFTEFRNIWFFGKDTGLTTDPCP